VQRNPEPSASLIAILEALKKFSIKAEYDPSLRDGELHLLVGTKP